MPVCDRTYPTKFRMARPTRALENAGEPIETSDSDFSDSSESVLVLHSGESDSGESPVSDDNHMVGFDQALAIAQANNAAAAAAAANMSDPENDFDDNYNSFDDDYEGFNDGESNEYDIDKHTTVHFWFGTLAMPKDVRSIPELGEFRIVSYNHQDIYNPGMPDGDLSSVLQELRMPQNWDLPLDQYRMLLREMIERLR